LETQSSTELTPEVARARLPELQAQLAVRQSTTHFARAGVALVACVVFSVAAIGLVVFAWGQYRRGMAHHRREMELFASLQAVHRALHLDDPAALLPR